MILFIEVLGFSKGRSGKFKVLSRYKSRLSFFLNFSQDFNLFPAFYFILNISKAHLASNSAFYVDLLIYKLLMINSCFVFDT